MADYIRLFGLFGLTTLTLVLTVVWGYVVLRATSQLDDLECLAFGGAVGVALAGGIAWLAFLLAWFRPEVYGGIAIFIFIISFSLARYRGRWGVPQVDFSQWYVYVAWWVVLFGTLALLPVYAGGGWYGDWWMHYDIAQFYLGERSFEVIYFEQYTVLSRTPLFNLAEAFYMALWGQDFVIYQLTALIPNTVFAPLFLLLVRSRRIGLLLTVLALHPFIWLNLLYPWPKLLTAAYILAGAYLYLRSRSPAWTWGLFIGLAILSHPSAVFYGLGLTLHLAWTHRHNLKMLAIKLVEVGAVTTVVIVPWLAWGGIRANNWLFLAGSVVGKEESFSPGEWLFGRIWNLGVTLIPHDLFGAIFQAVAEPMWPAFALNSLDPIFHYYYNTLPGALTTGLSIYLLKQPWPGWFKLLGVMGLAGGVLLQPGLVRHGVAPESMAPLILLGLVLIGREVVTADNSRRILGLLAFEYLLSRGLHTIMLAGYFFQPTEANFQLKQAQNIQFVRDGLNDSLVVGGVVLVVGVGYGLLWSFVKDGKPFE